MNISIPYGLTILFIIIFINCIFSLSKHKFSNICYMVISFVLAVGGGSWTIMIPTELHYRLQSHMVNGRLDNEFVIWAMDKFKLYAVRTILATLIILLVCSSILLIASIKKEHKLLYAIDYIVNIYRFVLILVGFWYSYQTINKEFDLASYIMNITLAQCLLLYLPLLIKKKLSWKRIIEQI